jgi:hypothetical protein
VYLSGIGGWLVLHQLYDRLSVAITILQHIRRSRFDKPPGNRHQNTDFEVNNENQSLLWVCRAAGSLDRAFAAGFMPSLTLRCSAFPADDLVDTNARITGSVEYCPAKTTPWCSAVQPLRPAALAPGVQRRFRAAAGLDNIGTARYLVIRTVDASDFGRQGRDQIKDASHIDRQLPSAVLTPLAPSSTSPMSRSATDGDHGR